MNQTATHAGTSNTEESNKLSELKCRAVEAALNLIDGLCYNIECVIEEETQILNETLSEIVLSETTESEDPSVSGSLYTQCDIDSKCKIVIDYYQCIEESCSDTEFIKCEVTIEVVEDDRCDVQPTITEI